MPAVVITLLSFAAAAALVRRSISQLGAAGELAATIDQRSVVEPTRDLERARAEVRAAFDGHREARDRAVAGDR